MLTLKTGRALIAEFVGAFALIFIGAGSIVTNQWTNGALGLPGIAAARALVLSIMISALGQVSGGHLNPAVTFGIWIARKVFLMKFGTLVTIKTNLGRQEATKVVEGLTGNSSRLPVHWVPCSLRLPAAKGYPGFLFRAVITRWRETSLDTADRAVHDHFVAHERPLPHGSG